MNFELRYMPLWNCVETLTHRHIKCKHHSPFTLIRQEKKKNELNFIFMRVIVSVSVDELWKNILLCVYLWPSLTFLNLYVLCVSIRWWYTAIFECRSLRSSFVNKFMYATMSREPNKIINDVLTSLWVYDVDSPLAVYVHESTYIHIHVLS